MKAKYLTLYRGISADQFTSATRKVFAKNKKVWKLILERRLNNDLAYPQSLDREIIELHQNIRLEFQHFTDSKSIAEGYARKVRGLLIEIKVPLKDVISQFELEFQNFGKRKKQFEVVYRVKGSVLAKRAKAWRLQVRQLKR